MALSVEKKFDSKKMKQFGNKTRHSWGTKLKTFGHNWGSVGAQLERKVNWGTVVTQLRQSRGKTSRGTVEAHMEHNLRIKWRKFDLGDS